jgi:hypothetical protein
MIQQLEISNQELAKRPSKLIPISYFLVTTSLGAS